MGRNTRLTDGTTKKTATNAPSPKWSGINFRSTPLSRPPESLSVHVEVVAWTKRLPCGNSSAQTIKNAKKLAIGSSCARTDPTPWPSHYFTKYCDVKPEIVSKFRCLGVRVLNTLQKNGLVSLRNVRMWKKVLQ